jgi:hypothetical protein
MLSIATTCHALIARESSQSTQCLRARTHASAHAFAIWRMWETLSRPLREREREREREERERERERERKRKRERERERGRESRT